MSHLSLFILCLFVGQTLKKSQNLSLDATKDEDPVQMQRENPSEEYKILFIYTVSSLGFRSILSQTCCCVIEDLPHQMLI